MICSGADGIFGGVEDGAHIQLDLGVVFVLGVQFFGFAYKEHKT